MAKPLPHDANRDLASGFADHAMLMMRSLSIAPTPKHYAIFFACAAGQPTDLAREMEVLIEQHQTITDELLDRLYDQHLAATQNRVIADTALSARKIITEMVQTVAAFTGTTHEVGQEVSHKLANIGDNLTENDLRDLAKTVIDSASAMKASSESVTRKLAGAQEEIASLRQNLAKATTESERDFLTNTYNRKAFDMRLMSAMEEADADGSELTLLMLDIDHFKQFNDKFGHQIGDEVLKIVAKTLTDAVKGADIVARFGGEEFSIILPRTPVGGGMIVAESVRKLIAGKEFKNKSSGETYGTITVSVGVASFRHHHHDAPSQLIKRADEALYRSKHAGRNRVTQENLSEEK